MARLTIADLEIERAEDLLEYETADGTVYTLPDPQAVQLDSLIHLESLPMAQQLQAIMGAEFDEFSKQPDVDAYVFKALIANYLAHYGLGSPGEGRASKRSSKGSAKR